MNRTGILVLMGLLLMSVLIVSCGSDSPFALACETNNTATLRFANYTVTSKTYDVLLDGSKVVSNLGPGSTSGDFTISAGVTHTVDFRIAGTGTAACTTAYPNKSACAGSTISCAN